MNLSRLTTDELIRHADNSVDELTTTDLERELLARLMVLADRSDVLEEIEEISGAMGVTTDEAPKVFALLETYNCGDLATLEQKLKRADDWYALADEAGDLFSRLEGLRAQTI